VIQTLIADDHAIIRQGLKYILTDAPDIIVADEASDGKEALAKALNGHYDVVVLDITMPDSNGLEVLKELKRQRPSTKVLILSMHPEEQYAVRALRAGASGYLTKDSTPEELIHAMRQVVLGRRYVSRSLGEILASELEPNAEHMLHHALSDREYAVMGLIVAGKRVTEIGSEMGLSVKTVSTYKSRVMRKMRMKTTAELVRYSMENGLLM
jgi:two-component system invasion response regulator UvrY